MNITRHFIDVGSRRVHYRLCGTGPPLLMIHQSPRSSAEYEPLIRQWSAKFTCIAPDTPGFGQSDPLPGEPEIGDLADALAQTLKALRISKVAAYGFHSGGIIAVAALRRRPDLFSALAVGGYPIWTPEEMEIFGERYLPPFLPSDYGEHLTWLWNRILEQTWFFPWFDVRDEVRLTIAHADPSKVDAVIQDMLDAGDDYRAGYGAVLRAPRDTPPPETLTPPVLITAYAGDPLQPHIDRLGATPANWQARKVASPAEHQSASLDFLLQHSPAPLGKLAEAADEGFVHVEAGRFAGAVHWRGSSGGPLTLHKAGESLEMVRASEGVAVDLPGHGLSDPWTDVDLSTFVAELTRLFDCSSVTYPAIPKGDPDLLFPLLEPDRFGSYLTAAWSIVRARVLFDPWYDARAAKARRFNPSELAPERLAVAHRALLRATGAKNYLMALISIGDDRGNA